MNTDFNGKPILILDAVEAYKVMESLAKDDDVPFMDPLFQKVTTFINECVGEAIGRGL